MPSGGALYANNRKAAIQHSPRTGGISPQKRERFEEEGWTLPFTNDRPRRVSSEFKRNPGWPNPRRVNDLLHIGFQQSLLVLGGARQQHGQGWLFFVAWLLGLLGVSLFLKNRTYRV
jgi:hypothetical protein